MTESVYNLFVVSSDLNHTSGWHSVNCYVEEILPDGNVIKGIQETYGIHPNVLRDRHDGDIVKWLSWVADEMEKKHTQRSAIQTSILDWHGKRFAILRRQTAPSPPPPPPAPIPVHDK